MSLRKISLTVQGFFDQKKNYPITRIVMSKT